MKTCTHDMKPGMALIPILGSHTHPVPRDGDTIYPVGSKLGPVQKCAICGYSVSMQAPRIRGVDDARAHVQETK